MLRLLTALAALIAMATASSDGEYTIMYSSTLRLGSPLEISVLIPRIDEPVTLTAQLSLFSWRDGTTVLHTENKLYNNLNGLNEDTWAFSPPASALSEMGTYRLQVNGTGGVTFSNTSDVTVARKTMTVFVQTDKPMYKPGQKVQWRIYQFDPDLQPMYDTFSVSLKDNSDNLLWQQKNIERSAGDNMGVVKGEYQLSDQPVLGSWKIEVQTPDGEKTSQSFEVAEFVLPKFEVEMKFDAHHHLMSDATIKGKVCGKYTYGKDLKGNATVEISVGNQWGSVITYTDHEGYYQRCGFGNYCRWNSEERRSVCKPNDPCPGITHQVTLEKGCAEIEITKKELYFLYPSLNELMKKNGLDLTSQWGTIDYHIRQEYNAKQVIDFFKYKILSIKANVTEEATGKTIPGDASIKFITNELTLKFSDQMEKNFKPGLPFRVIVEAKGPDSEAVEPDMLKNRKGQPLTMKLEAYKMLYYYWSDWNAFNNDEEKVRGVAEQDPTWTYGGYRGSKRSLIVNWTMPVPTDGVIVHELSVPDDANFEKLEFQATMQDRYGEDISMGHTVDVHQTKTKNQLSLSKTLVPGGKDQPGSVMSFQIKSTASFDKIYYFVMGKGQVRKQDVLEFSPAREEYNLDIILDANFARQISPSGRILILACITKDDKEEMLAASLDFTVDGAMANHLNLRFSPNETLPGNEVTLTLDTEPNSYVTLMAMDKSMILMGGNGNDVTEDEVMDQLREYDSAGSHYPTYYRGRRKRSSMGWCPWCMPYSRGGNDPSEVVKNAGAVVLSSCPLYSREPERNFYEYRNFGGELDMDVAEAGPMPGADEGLRGQAGPAPPADNGLNADDEAESTGVEAPLKTVDRVRTEFPESWIWTEIESRSDGTQELKVTAPDTITTWQLSGMSLNQNKGLGLANTDDKNTKLRVFKPFFVSLDLPYHMIQGEEAKMQITVFNYQPNEQEVIVTLKASDEYIIKTTIEQNEVIQKDEIYKLKLAADDSETIVVYLRPIVITAAMNVEVHAQSPSAADAVRRKLVVKPRGKAEEKTDSVLVILDESTGSFTHQLKVSDLLPEGALREKRDANGKVKMVPGSEYIYVSAQGDLMGSTLDNLGSLIKMPYGCGEQNMINFVPNIHVMRYFDATNKGTDAMKAKAKNYMRAGYSRELTYQHSGGGFSAFGDRDDSASTWLTAFVIKSFQEARDFIPDTVDAAKIEYNVQWLLRTQESREGWFREDGKVLHGELKGGAGKGDALTAYVLTALQTVVNHLENENLKTQTQEAIVKAQNYLERHLEDGQYDGKDASSYTLAIVTKALVCSSSTSQDTKDKAINKLAAKAFNKDGKTHWADSEEKEPEDDTGYRRWRRTPSTDVERTAYGAMAYMCKDGRSNLGEVVPIVKWLITQQGPYGGYSSTQDTVLTIGFLADFSSDYSSNENMRMDVSLKTNNNEYSFNTITADNAAVLQKQQLDKTAEYVNVMASGTAGGIAVVQLVVKYYTEVEAPEPAITVDVLTNMLPSSNAFSLTVCGKWEKDEDSAMGVVTLTLPSGYEADTSELLELNKEVGAKRIDRNENEINIYVDKFVAGEELCFGPLVAEQVNEVFNLQEAKVVMYDYYDTAMNGYVMYLPPELKSAGLSVGRDPAGPSDGSGGEPNTGNVQQGDGSGSSCLAANVVLATLLSLLVTLFLHNEE